MIRLIVILCTVAMLSDPFSAGETGPGMLIIHEPDEPIVQQEGGFTQSLQIHQGWNLVSWHIVPPDPTPQNYLQMIDILPDDGTNDWFFDHGGQVYEWLYRNLNYPDDPFMHTEEWDLDYAYFMLLDIAHPWQFQYRPRFELNPITDFNPSPEWDSNRFDPQHLAIEWFFMGYAAPGYCKLASIPVPGASPQCGDPEDYNYEGPFHWLIWENDGQDYPPYDLKIVRTDDGRFYIPTPDDPDDIVDQIEVLEPGRGYFLGFDAEANETYTFEGWGNWPQWQNDQFIGPEPKSPVTQIASATHFQFNPYTHWAYPVLIDTVDLAEIPMEPGDEMGVFDGDLCVGASVYSGEFPLVIACWEDDIATPVEIDGYIWNDPMIFKWYDASENTEAELVSPPGTQAADDPIAPTYSGFGRGFYALRSFYGGAQNTVQFPKDYRLGQNYPNPFNAETVIPLELPERSKVKLEIFNVRGQRIGFPYENVYNAGWPRIRWNASRLPSGVYFYRITAEGLERGGKFHDVGKMLLLK